MERRKPLKRGGPLKRTSTLKTTKPLDSRSEIKTKPKPARSKAVRAASQVWKESTVSRGCEICAKRGEVCEDWLEAHHVIAQADLKKRGLKHLLWDPDNGLSACYKSHRRHTNRVQPIEREHLRPENLAFAERNGLMDLIERYYPE